MKFNFERAHNRYLDPPEPPAHERCDECKEMFDADDLQEIDFCYGEMLLCKDCEARLRAERYNELP